MFAAHVKEYIQECRGKWQRRSFDHHQQSQQQLAPSSPLTWLSPLKTYSLHLGLVQRLASGGGWNFITTPFTWRGNGAAKVADSGIYIVISKAPEPAVTTCTSTAPMHKVQACPSTNICKCTHAGMHAHTHARIWPHARVHVYSCVHESAYSAEGARPQPSGLQP